MKIWCSRFHGNDAEQILKWSTSKREAEAWLRERNAKEDCTGVSEAKPIDIPTDRKGLIQWLNEHFNTDNG